MTQWSLADWAYPAVANGYQICLMAMKPAVIALVLSS